MNDRMTTARTALQNSANLFREYEAHHRARALAATDPQAAADSQAKAQRNYAAATECEMALNLLTAQ